MPVGFVGRFSLVVMISVLTALFMVMPLAVIGLCMGRPDLCSLRRAPRFHTGGLVQKRYSCGRCHHHMAYGLGIPHRSGTGKTSEQGGNHN
jgi:hypothetical protein